MLRVESLRRLGLGPFDFEVADGACLAITGPSGAGKSVLLRAIADLDPNDGQVRCRHVVREDVPAPEWRRAVALLPAESGWWGDRVAQHFQDAGTLTPLLAKIGLSPDSTDWQVARLSTGERHRLALLRALERDPDVLLLDEPTTMLDHDTTLLVESLLKERMAQGMSIVMVTHDTDQPARMNAQTLWLEDGQLTDRRATS